MRNRIRAAAIVALGVASLAADIALGLYGLAVDLVVGPAPSPVPPPLRDELDADVRERITAMWRGVT